MLVEQLDPLWVLPFLLFLAAFAAGLELSQMPTKRKLPWEKNQPPRLQGFIYSLAIVAIILAGVWIAHSLEQVYP